MTTKDPNKGYLGAWLAVPKQHINVEGVKSALTFVFVQAEEVTTLSLWREEPDHLLVPREFWDVRELNFPVVDTRPTKYTRVHMGSRITLDAITPTESTQRNAMAALLAARGGVLQLACGKGKSVVALELAARMQVPTLIVVDNTQLLEQWRKLILGSDGKPGLLNLKEQDVGLIQGQTFDWKKPIVLATYHTLAARAHVFPQEVREWFGLTVWDEAHHIAAPTFCKTADLFYGYRLGLTATPTRTDGLHVIYNLHLGGVIHKDLVQELRPRICFLWTGLQPDMTDPTVASLAQDKNGEVHQGKLASFFGQWRPRLDLIINETRKAVTAGRKVLVLSNSIDELANLLALWTGHSQLLTDIPQATNADVNEKADPVELSSKELRKLLKQQKLLIVALKDPKLDPFKRNNLQQLLQRTMDQLEGMRVFKKVEAENRRRHRDYIRELCALPSNAGLMIRAVPAAERSGMLRAKDVVFAVSKYGREGLDEQSLDTVLICEPMSSRNGLQQIMGRVLRKKAGKKEPYVIFLEDDIGIFISMCFKLRKHLRDWPLDEGGPYEYELIGHPRTKRPKAWTRPTTLEYDDTKTG